MHPDLAYRCRRSSILISRYKLRWGMEFLGTSCFLKRLTLRIWWTSMYVSLRPGDSNRIDDWLKQSDSVQSLFYSTDAELGKKYMGAEGGFREWLEAGKVADAELWFSSKVWSSFMTTIPFLTFTIADKLHTGSRSVPENLPWRLRSSYKLVPCRNR